MSRREPQKQNAHAAFCEEFDEDADDVIPDTRQVANAAAKRSQPELQPRVGVADGSSDSGYSSRTAATVGSGDSFLTSGTELTPLDAPVANRAMGASLREPSSDKEKAKAGAKGKDKQREPQPKNSTDGSRKQPPPRRSSSRPAPQSTSKYGRRESVSLHGPCACWDCERQRIGYQQAAMTPGVDPSHYGHPIAQGYDIPPSPQTARYPPMVNQNSNPTPSTTRPRANTQGKRTRPVSYHGGAVPDTGLGYFQTGQTPPYGAVYGPPLSASAYANTFYSFPYMGGEPTPSYSPTAYQAPQPPPERPPPRRTSSMRSSSDKPSGRRQSIYGPPVVEYAKSPTAYHSGVKDRQPSHEERARRQPQAYDPDEDYYRMPPPPLPAPQQQQTQKQKPPPAQIIPVPNSKRPSIRKSNTTATTPTTDQGSPFDTADLRGALPAREGRKQSRGRSSPERRPSMSAPNRNSVRTTSYHDSGRAGPAAIESRGRSRNQTVYGLEQPRELEAKQREAEEYQAARSPRVPPLTARSLRKTKRSESDADSRQTPSESSRGCDSQTKRDSAASSSKVDEDDGITMVIGGVKIGLPADSDRRINVRSGEEGSFELNIGGNKQPNRYLTERSDSTSAGRPAEIEDVRRTREDARSEKTSRRSSRSGYSGRGLLE